MTMKQKNLIIYYILMIILFVLFLNSDKLGIYGILLGYFVGLLTGIFYPPKK